MGYNIAIDGPAGAGKSTIAKLVAKELGFIYVDTGAMYRGLAVHFLKKGIVPGEVEKIEAACEDAKVELGYENGVQQVYLNGENITSQLREETVGNMASVSSAVPAVRAKLLDLQRNLAKEKDKTNIMLMEKLRAAEQKAENYNSLEQKVISLNQEVSNLQFKIKDYEKNELLHIKEIEQLKKEKENDSSTIEKLNREKLHIKENTQKELSEKESLLTTQEKELNTLRIQLAEQVKDAELIKERAVIEKEREMISKTEELRNTLDIIKEEKYNLQLELSRLKK